MKELELKHLAGYLPYGLKWHLPLTSERYESILENECYGIIELAWAIENNYPNAEDYLKMTFSQPNPFIAIEDNELFIGQMKCSLGWEEDDVYLKEMKPILRPLSDLTKEIEVNGEKFVPYKKMHLVLSYVEEFLNEDLWIGQEWDFERVELLMQWHFDIYGLIESGIAIDINALNRK